MARETQIVIVGNPYPVFVTKAGGQTENIAGSSLTDVLTQPGPNPTITTMQMPIFRRVAMIPG